MAISIRHNVSEAHLDVTGTPRPEHLYEWWSMLKSDPEDIARAFADGFPSSLDAFLERVWKGTYREFNLIMHGDDVAASFWLHDAMSKDGVTIGGWFAGYIVPHYRPTGAAIWEKSRDCLAGAGIRHLFSAVHEGNRPSRRYTHGVMRFHRVGKYSDFTHFDGQLVNVVIYTQNKADAHLAWEEASKRQERNLSLVEKGGPNR